MNRVPTLAAALIVFVAASPLAAQPAESPARDSDAFRATPLGIRQQRVERMMHDLEEKFRSLAQALQKTEPERAERLARAIEQARELLLQQRMSQVAQRLDEARLDVASSEQKLLLADLKRLLDVLLSEDEDRRKLLEEIERLQRWRDEIARLIAEEAAHHADSAKLDDKDKTLADLARQILALESILRRQQDIAGRTAAARSEGIQRLGRLADEQRALREETEALAEEVAAAGALRPSAAAGGMPMPAGGSPMPGGGQNPAGGQGQGGGQSPGGGMSGGMSGGSASPSPSSPQPGQQSLEKAAGHEGRAEKALGRGQGVAAEADQSNALMELQKALDELKRERARIASLPPEAFDELARKQDETTEKTARLEAEMSQAPPSGGSSSGGGSSGGGASGGGQSGEGSSGSPGQQGVQKSKESMQRAAGSLRKKDPGDASRHQDHAIRELEDAIRRIEERLAQLREEMQAERLARLEARFRDMLDRQLRATAATVELDGRKLADEGKLSRADRLALKKLADEERALSLSAEQAYELIVEDGTSAVFPRIVEELRDDLSSVAGLLDAERTDKFTQFVQRQIEATLRELLEALERAKRQLEGRQGGQGQGGGQGDEPLLPGSAELKLLRSAQLRVNRRTVEFESSRAGDPPDEISRRLLLEISRRQDEIALMTQAMIDRYAP
jgi:hypothetical protein